MHAVTAFVAHLLDAVFATGPHTHDTLLHAAQVLRHHV